MKSYHSSMQQRSSDWHSWRKLGVGASDSNVIMGVSKYADILDLYNEKLGLAEPKPVNGFITQLGHDFEPKIRARFELETGHFVEPETVVHEDHEWIRASLDACSFEHRIFAEIKYVGQKKINEVRSTMKVLDEHHPQVQHQFLATGFISAYYVCYTLSKDRKEITDYFSLNVSPDPVYIQSLLYPAIRSFWSCVQNKTPPKIVEKIKTKKRGKRVKRGEIET